MQFTSINFLIFFPIVVLVYYLLPDKWKKTWILVINYYFYFCFGLTCVVVLQVITAVTYTLGRGIGILRKIDIRKTGGGFLLGSIGSITALCILRYLIATVPSLHPVSVFFPVGISFYLLQAVGYVLDVYKGKISAEKNYIQYSAFLSFFPTIISGPIEKAEHFLPQLEKSHRFDYDNVKNGLLLMIWGYFEKIAVADLAGILIDSIYSDYKIYSGWMIIFATVLYAFQLYADFDGYSNIAVGTAQVLGYDLIQNFRRPYFADGIKEFWRRWHISLSSWLKEYVYIPLGGSRRGNRYINIIITFTVSGLWHGGGLHYWIWGVLHGFFHTAEAVIMKYHKTNNRGRFYGLVVKIFKIVLTFSLVDFAWLFFRASDTKTAWGMLNKIFCELGSITGVLDESISTGISMLQIFFMSIGLLCILTVDVMHALNWKIRERISGIPIVFRWGIYYIILFAVLTILIANMGIESENFIYGQF